MARQTFEDWIKVDYADTVIQRPAANSAILATVPAQPMKSETKEFARSGAAHATTVAKGSAFSEDSGTNDKVVLSAVKFGLGFRIANEDLDDSMADIIENKKIAFANSYATLLDNACLGTTAAANLGTVPFNSLYKALRTTDSATGYTADANRIATSAGVAVTYANLSALVGKSEGSQWYSPNQVIIAHPGLKQMLRDMVDGNGRPLFIETGAGTPDTLFNLPIKFTLGAATSATASDAPAGNKLIFAVNPDYLILGDRGGVKAKVAGEAAAGTDETLLYLQARNAFAVAAPGAHAVLEVVPA